MPVPLSVLVGQFRILSTVFAIIPNESMGLSFQVTHHSGGRTVSKKRNILSIHLVLPPFRQFYGPAPLIAGGAFIARTQHYLIAVGK